MAEGERKKRVLVVDDCPATREMLTVVLEVEGYATDTAGDGREALRRLHGTPPPALILLDLMMPGMSGWEFLRRRADDPRLAAVPVVVLSALTDPEADLAALGAAACITKPISEDGLLDRVAGAVHATLAQQPAATPGNG